MNRNSVDNDVDSFGVRQIPDDTLSIQQHQTDQGDGAVRDRRHMGVRVRRDGAAVDRMEPLRQRIGGH